MTSVHKQLTARVGQPRLDAIFLDTPFGFQPNADEIVARTVTYFRLHVGCEIGLASFRHGGQATPLETERFLARLSEANYIFAGPGSPTYALRHWRNTGMRDRLAEKVDQGGCVAFASAAAIGLGAYALPVYEIYKVGEDPSWTAGLEAMLPDDRLILGIDEYTACIIDVEAQSVSVRGRGEVTARRQGSQRAWTRTTFPLSMLQNPSQASATTPSRPVPSVLQERIADLGGTGERDRVRAEMRHLVVRLGELARDGGRQEVRECVAPLVDVLLSMRGEARREQRFREADRLRAILADCGVEVQDTPAGTEWSLVNA